MKQETIVYKKGNVDIDASIAAELKNLEEFEKGIIETEKVIEALKAFQADNSRLGEVDRSAYAYMLIDILKEKCECSILDRKTGEVNKNTIQGYGDGTYARLVDMVDELFFRGGSRDLIVTEITKNGVVVYQNDDPTNADPLQVYLSIREKFGNDAADRYLQKAIHSIDTGWDRIYLDESRSLLGNIKSLIERGNKCIYPQNFKKWAEYMLIYGATPDMSEDEFMMGLTDEIAVQTLEMIEGGKTVDEVCEYLKGTDSGFVDESLIDCIVLRFGKEKGVQVYEQKVLKPAEKKGEVSYLDYVGTPVEKIKKRVEEQKAENKKYEEELATGTFGG